LLQDRNVEAEQKLEAERKRKKMDEEECRFGFFALLLRSKKISCSYLA
jgi:hypothetical protein